MLCAVSALTAHPPPARRLADGSFFTTQLGGTSATVTIPATGVSGLHGAALKAALQGGTVDVSMFDTEAHRDSAMDLSIVAHE